jgi:hypothetical protein
MATTTQWIQYFGSSKSPVTLNNTNGPTVYGGGTVPSNAPSNISAINFYGLSDSSTSTTPSPIFWGGYSCSVYVGITHSGTFTNFWGNWYQISNIPTSLTSGASYSIQGKVMNPTGTFPAYSVAYTAPTTTSTGDSTLTNNQYLSTNGFMCYNYESIASGGYGSHDDVSQNQYWGFDCGYMNNTVDGVSATNYQTLSYGQKQAYYAHFGTGLNQLSDTTSPPLYSIPVRLQLNLSGYTGSAVNETRNGVGQLTYFWAEN